MIIGDQHADAVHPGILPVICKKGKTMSEKAREKIRKLIITGDNRLKQGVDPAKARESFDQALELARQEGLEDEVRPLVELRLADLERLARESPRSAPPDA